MESGVSRKTIKEEGQDTNVEELLASDLEATRTNWNMREALPGASNFEHTTDLQEMLVYSVTFLTRHLAQLGAGNLKEEIWPGAKELYVWLLPFVIREPDISRYCVIYSSRVMCHVLPCLGGYSAGQPLGSVLTRHKLGVMSYTVNQGPWEVEVGGGSGVQGYLCSAL